MTTSPTRAPRARSAPPGGTRLQQPYPPIWVAARSPDTIAWALKRGYNLLATPWRDPFSRIQKHHAQVMEIAASVGVAKPPRLAVSRMTYVGKTDGDALEAMADIQVSHRIFMRLFRNQANVKGGFTLPEPVDDEYSRERLPGEPGRRLAGDLRREAPRLRGARHQSVHPLRRLRARSLPHHGLAPALRRAGDAALPERTPLMTGTCRRP